MSWRIPHSFTHPWRTWIKAVQTLLVELRTDHGSYKTTVDELVTLTTELRTDHGSFKTAVDTSKTLTDELRDDHATNKTAVDSLKVAVDELVADHATFRTALLAYKQYMQQSLVSGDPGVGIGSTATKVRTNAEVQYTIKGVVYTKASTDDLWTLTGGNLATASARGYFLYLDAAGAASVEASTDAATIGAVVWPGADADKALIGAVTVENASGADFVPGTTGLSAAGITDTYYDGLDLAAVLLAVLPDPPATLSAPAVSAGYATITAAAATAGPATITAPAPDTPV